MSDVIALVGSPNSGKSTLFNLLTGSTQKTANYPGVTVEKCEGYFNVGNSKKFTLLDLPGTYSITAESSSVPIDERITRDVLFGKISGQKKPDYVLAIADITNLSTHLYLVLELIEHGFNVALVLTMSDLSKKEGISVNVEKLQDMLQIPVAMVSAKKKLGVDALRAMIADFFSDRQSKVREVNSTISLSNSYQVLNRYQKIDEILKACTERTLPKENWTYKIDKIILNRYLGPLIMSVLFAALFQLLFVLAKVPMGWIEAAIETAQQIAKTTLQGPSFDAPALLLLKDLLINGVLSGTGSVLAFLPQILILFFFILVLEESGLMARSAFIMDRIMGGVGLHGRAFIPLLSSFACAVPGIMATRTIDQKKDRLLTILIAPLMTCSARLPVYTMLIGAFVPDKQVFFFLNLPGLVLFGLYLSSVLIAFCVAWIFKKTLFKKDKNSFVIELPKYHLPSFTNIARGLLARTKIFLRRAGTIILFVSFIMWALFSFPKTQGLIQGADLPIEQTYAGKIGKTLEPIFEPIGFDWKITVAILSSFAAREVVLSTLGTIYAVEEGTSSSLGSKLKEDSHFSFASAISLLVFYVLACQCASTLAVVRRETNSLRWPVFLFTYMSILAYIAALIAYRLLS
ncbi:MAG: ferrous iron transporter B [Bacteriovoracia bacterium]